MIPFGGIDLDLLASLIGSGYATWFRRDPAGTGVKVAHGARVVNAPIETVYEAVTDFGTLHEQIGLLKPPIVKDLGDDRFEVHFRAQIGLAVFKIGAEIGFRMRHQAPSALHMDEYLGGSFERSTLELHCHALPNEQTLLAVSFCGDIRSFSGIARYFLSRIPELEPAIEGNMVVIPLMAMGTRAEARAKRSPLVGTDSPRIDSRLAELPQDLLDGFFTIGRTSADGGIAEVCAVTRVAAPVDRVWDVIHDPARLTELVSFIRAGRIVGRTDTTLELEIEYRARLGPLRKRYPIRVTAETQPPHRLHATTATTVGVPTIYGDTLLSTDGGTVYAHTFHTDLKQDWLTRTFLSGQPELERLIAQYPPLMQVIAVRRHFDGAR